MAYYYSGTRLLSSLSSDFFSICGNSSAGYVRIVDVAGLAINFRHIYSKYFIKSLSNPEEAFGHMNSEKVKSNTFSLKVYLSSRNIRILYRFFFRQSIT